MRRGSQSLLIRRLAGAAAAIAELAGRATLAGYRRDIRDIRKRVRDGGRIAATKLGPIEYGDRRHWGSRAGHPWRRRRLRPGSPARTLLRAARGSGDRAVALRLSPHTPPRRCLPGGASRRPCRPPRCSRRRERHRGRRVRGRTLGRRAGAASPGPCAGAHPAGSTGLRTEHRRAPADPIEAHAPQAAPVERSCLLVGARPCRRCSRPLHGRSAWLAGAGAGLGATFLPTLNGSIAPNHESACAAPAVPSKPKQRKLCALKKRAGESDSRCWAGGVLNC